MEADNRKRSLSYNIYIALSEKRGNLLSRLYVFYTRCLRIIGQFLKLIFPIGETG